MSERFGPSAGVGGLAGDLTGGVPSRRRFVSGLRGRFGLLSRVSGGVRGRSAGVQNAALDRYEVFLGSGGGEPDYSAAPAASGSSLPVNVALGDGTWRVVVRRRNRWNVVSENVGGELVVVSSGEGEEVPAGAPSLEVLIAGWFVLVRGWWVEDPEVTAPATWELKVTQKTSGADVDQLFSEAVRLPDGVAFFEELVELQDLTALPSQTGVVEVDLWLESAAGTVGALAEESVSAPGDVLSGGGFGGVWEGDEVKLEL